METFFKASLVILIAGVCTTVSYYQMKPHKEEKKEISKEQIDAVYKTMLKAMTGNEERIKKISSP